MEKGITQKGRREAWLEIIKDFLQASSNSDVDALKKATDLSPFKQAALDDALLLETEFATLNMALRCLLNYRKAEKKEEA